MKTRHWMFFAIVAVVGLSGACLPAGAQGLLNLEATPQFLDFESHPVGDPPQVAILHCHMVTDFPFWQVTAQADELLGPLSQIIPPSNVWVRGPATAGSWVSMEKPVLLRENMGFEPDAMFDVEVYIEGAVNRVAGGYAGPIYVVASGGIVHGQWGINRQAVVVARYAEKAWLQVEAWPDKVRFHADRGPITYEGDRDVTVNISANWFVSDVTVLQTPLRGTDRRKAKIPTDRLWIEWQFENGGSGGGEGTGTPQDEDRIWDLGGVSPTGWPPGWPLSQDLVLKYFYRCDLVDRPGLYEGKSTVTALITP